MRRFARLFAEIDGTASTKAKVEAMRRYFDDAPPEDASWALFLLAGRRLRRTVKPSDMRRWAMDALRIERWLYAECHTAVGDGAETIALLFDAHPVGREAGAEPARVAGLFTGAGARQDSDEPDSDDAALHVWIEERLRGLAGMTPEEQRPVVVGWWRRLPPDQAMLVTKMLTGALRVGVAKRLVLQAVGAHAGVHAAEAAAHLTGDWSPRPGLLDDIRSGRGGVGGGAPYPFFLASPVQATSTAEAGADEVAALLGDRAAWLAEWKWDGIRAQLIRRGDSVTIWSRGDEELTDRFPELVRAGGGLPDGSVLDGEIVAWDESADRPLPFAALQRRIGRTSGLAAAVASAPTVFLAFDLLEAGGEDVRSLALSARRALLRELVAGVGERLRVSEAVEGAGWAELEGLRATSRTRLVEGLMLKRLDSAYGVGRARGDWWKWKIYPHTLDCVMVYAEPGHGRRASLLTDYTFAVWRGKELVPIARAYSGLSNDEIDELDRWIRRHTKERFGRVRRVAALQVFELAFDAVQRSDRHSSGVALRFPRIVRWRRDKGPEAADRLEDVEALIPPGAADVQGLLFPPEA